MSRGEWFEDLDTLRHAAEALHLARRYEWEVRYEDEFNGMDEEGRRILKDAEDGLLAMLEDMGLKLTFKEVEE